MSKTFLIVGDSWSQGEIEHYPNQEKSHVVVHRGLIQYLEDEGHSVFNRGGLGWTNMDAYWQTYSAFFDNTHCNYPLPIDKNIDYIVWFTTDSFRDLNESQYLEKITVNKSIRKTFLETLDQCYSRFNELSNQIGKKIYLIGGWTPVSSEVTKYENLITIIPDVHKMLVPESDISLTHACLHLFDHVKNTANIAKQFLNTEEIDFIKQEIIDLTKELMHAENVRQHNKPLFYPDNHHPNRKGHYQIFTKVKEVLRLT